MEENKKQNIYKIIMLVALTALITFTLTTILIYNKVGLSSDASNGAALQVSNENGLAKVLKEFKTILNQEYIGEINEENLVEGAMKGYVDALGDPYTEYLTKDEMKELMEDTSGKYVGIGVYVANNTADNTILVVGVMKGSPALEAGMQAGDIVTKIDGVAYKGEELTKATSILKGQENTTVKVTVLREGKEKELTITRKTITIEHVASKMLDNNIGYIQIDGFEDGVAKKFEEEYNKLKQNNLKGLIIDLRSNGGGVVDEATDIADLFTQKDKEILITEDKNGKEKITKAKREKIISDIPLVILTNEGTASASEILAGALRDNYNAKLVGKNTYGKGVIQTVYKLTDGSGLKITTEQYYTPKHNKIHKVGLAPDVEVDLTKDEKGNYQTDEKNDAQLLKAIEILNK